LLRLLSGLFNSLLRQGAILTNKREKKMEKRQMEYRKSEIEKVEASKSVFCARIKITKEDGETKWMDITESELSEIKRILTSES